MPTHEARGRALVGNDDTVLAAFHSPDGDQIATSGLGGIWLWNAASGKLEQKLTPPLPSLKGAFSNDGSMVAGTGFGGTVFVYDLTTGESTALPALSESGWTRVLRSAPTTRCSPLRTTVMDQGVRRLRHRPPRAPALRSGTWERANWSIRSRDMRARSPTWSSRQTGDCSTHRARTPG